ncbi:cell division protein FtsQ [Citrobacter koseri]|uniref:Cell division protein FtsQ n=1 Tax=Citrobacter koseri TaxID=545 RepID=A0A2X2VHG2_CITKO|nr:cell division protein FtsQ [Citrobacter koseri]
MSQAALNTRNSDEEVSSSRRNNGTRLAGILFLLTVLCTVFVSGWVVLGWMEDAAAFAVVETGVDRRTALHAQ